MQVDSVLVTQPCRIEPLALAVQRHRCPLGPRCDTPPRRGQPWCLDPRIYDLLNANVNLCLSPYREAFRIVDGGFWDLFL
jgi:hypothetical protein